MTTVPLIPIDFKCFPADRTYVTVELMVRVVDCRSVVCHECIVAKWCEIWPKLLLIINRKSHIGFQRT